MNKLWPFRRGDDAQFIEGNKPVGIYEAVATAPERNFEDELVRYQQWRYKGGMIQSFFPAALYGGLIGVCAGFQRARDMRSNRIRACLNSSVAYATIGVSIAAAHQFLLVKDKYQNFTYQPIAAAAVGSGVITLWLGMQSFVATTLSAVALGGGYIVFYKTAEVFERRKLRNFMHTQQMSKTPINRVAPEFQQLYRAYLYDNRPIEGRELERQKAAKANRIDELETRLDAQAFVDTMYPEIYYWVSFPEWWPFKVERRSEEESAKLQRLQQENFERRRVSLLQQENFIVPLNRPQRWRDQDKDSPRAEK